MAAIKEVSCKVLDAYIKEVEKKQLSVQDFLYQCPHDLTYLKNKNHRITWSEFIQVLDNFTQRLHYSFEDIRQLGRESINAPFMAPIFLIARGLFTLPELFSWLHDEKKNKLIRYLFTCIEIKHSVDDDNYFTITFLFDEGYHPAQAFLWSSLGVMESLPTIYGKPMLDVDFQQTNKGAIYRCYVPPVGGLFSRIRRFITAPFVLPKALRQIQQSYAELNDKNVLLMRENDQLLDMQKRLSKANKKALIAAKTKSSFVAKVSHELRTPLNGIMGANELLQDTALNIQQKNFSDVVQESSKQLLKMINELLDLGHVESDVLKLNLVDFNISVLSQDMNALCNDQNYDQFLFKVVVDPLLKTKVLHGDVKRINQIIKNLYSNAVNWTEIGFICLKLSNEENNLIITITDSGVGISDEFREKIFQPFFQIDKNSKGAGLGLAIVKDLVELMNGKIHFTSQIDQGSEFVVSLPIVISNNLDCEKDFLNYDFSGLQCLIVEDNIVNQMIISEFLNSVGINYDLAENGLVALEKAMNKEYGVILMDIDMPVMNGIEASKAIRKKFTQAVLPIIAVTASVSKDNIAEYAKIGINQTLAKPIQKDVLYKTIYHQVNARSHLPKVS